jgi:BirA family transcriptional regulator, biotin operon repressor / biotin---[acetyl-CoA-carboxylase] ligase
LSHHSHNGRIGEPFIELFTIDSTNNYAMGKAHAGLAKHGTVYIAESQTAGKGQRAKAWMTAPGENITLSCVLQPAGPYITRPFYLSAAIALGCHDFLTTYALDEVSIKWPNDVYWRDRKAGGILIENIYRAGLWEFAIVGIGLNINQAVFSPDLPNPVSLKQITGKTHDRLQLARELCSRLDTRYRQFAEGSPSLLEEYIQVVFRLNETVRLRKDNVVFETRVKGVSPQGQLVTFDTMERQFDFGEVEWVI